MMVTEEMVEKAAMAMFEADGLKHADNSTLEQSWIDSPRFHDEYRRRARAALSAVIPEGYAVVPTDPTNAMVRAMCKAMSPNRRPTPEYVSVKVKHSIRYRAAVEAAP